MEPPFSVEEQEELIEVIEWVYAGRKFIRGFHLENGKDPLHILSLWRPWINTCIDLMDGEGAFHHWPYAGARADQPAFDMGVYRIIKAKWVDLRNEEMKAEDARIQSRLKGLKR